MRSSTNNYAAARTALLIEDPCTYRKNCQQGALPKPLDGCALCHHSRNEAYYLDLGLVDPLPVWALDVEIRVVTDLITQVEGGHERTLS
jgi:hypothetical protein